MAPAHPSPGFAGVVVSACGNVAPALVGPATIPLVAPAAPQVRVVGRYALYGAIAAGGMATVHLGRLMGPVGFSRTVAIKRLHAQYASDPEFVSMFLDEARLAARIRHPNVVPTLDVVATSGELFLVMEYVPGESLSRLSRAARERRTAMPLRVLSAIMTSVLHGLHAAHEARDERGSPLGIVHRDVSPQNVLVGTDGQARVLDFGVAKAAGRMQTTKEGQIKGKLAYMPPEQLKGGSVTRQTDIYAAGVMLWELLTGQRLFSGDNEGAIVAKVLEGRIEQPSIVLARSHGATMNDKTMRALEMLDGTAMRALRMDPEQRYDTAREMALELERMCPPATASEVGDWVEAIAKDVLHSRAALVAEIESSASYSTEMRENGVMQVLNSKTMGMTGETPATNEGSDAMNLARTLAMPSAMASGVPGAPASGTPARHSSPFLPPYADPPVTQPSSISVSHRTQAPGEPGAKARPYLAAVAGIMVGATLLTGVLYVVKRTSRINTTVPPVAVDIPGTVQSTGVSPAIPPTMTAQPGVAVPGTTQPGVAIAPHPPVATPPAWPTAQQPPPQVLPKPKQPPRPPQKPVAPATPVDDCNPDFTIGADGVKRFKPQCLK